MACRTLLAWVHEYDGLVVEDDDDGELRYDIAPLPALASLDPHGVAYLGTCSEVLYPALASASTSHRRSSGCG